MKTTVWRFLRKKATLATLAASILLSTPSQADEFRGLWVDAFGSGFLNSSEVTALVNDCKTYNFNAVVVQMRRRGDAFYMPQAPNGDPRTTAIAANYDALADLVTKCHASNPRIEVHCWVAANLVWGDTTKSPTQAGHVFNLHPEYLTTTSGGVNTFGEGYFVDPGNPNAMTWNYNMARDIVSRYDIDGFHWDYIRYPQPDSGYNPTAIARFNAEFNLTGQPSSSSSQFSTWRRRQVTDFVRWTSSDLLEIKPSLVISAAVFGNKTDAVNSRFQNWPSWNTEGIIDIAMPMIYSSDNSVYTTRVDDAFISQGIRRCYVGAGAYLNVAANTVTQLDYARTKGFDGTVLFSYRTPNSGTVNQDATFQLIKNNYQPTWEPTPALPWIASPTKGLVKGTVVNSNNNEPVYNATVSLTGPATKSQKSEAHGKYAFFEVAPGTYNVAATSSGVSSGPVSVTVTAGGIYNVNLGINLPFNPDTTAPVLTLVRATGITSNSCTIAWTTSEASDSVVEYGTTAALGSSASNAAMVTSHSVLLTGLIPGTTYIYQANSSDASGNQGSSDNFQFTTAPAQSDLIIDTPNATVAGTWTTASASTDKFGADYKFKGKGTGTAHLTFTPTIVVGGNYQVFEYHPAGSNRATNVPYVVTSLAGTQTYFVNQQLNGGKWNYIGTYYFEPGTAGRVRITDGFADAAAGRVAMADAIRFTYLPDQEVSELIIDNPAAAMTGSWTLQTNSNDKFGADYRFRSRGTNSNFMTYTPSFQVAGNYQVYEWHPAGNNRGTNVPHIINHSLGQQTVTANQQVNGGKWNLLGTFGFSEGNSGFVRITDGFSGPTNGVVTADAVRLVYVPPPAPPAPPTELAATPVSTTQIDLEWTASASGLHFVVGRSTTAGGPYTDIATVPANTTTYSDDDLTANTTYFYVVRSVGVGGPSNPSGEANATTLPNPPQAPHDLVVTAISQTQIEVAWDDGDSLDQVFIVSRSTNASSGFVDIATTEARITSYSDSGLTASTTYYYKIRAHNSGGDSASSNIASATTFSAAPAAPTNLAAVAVSPTQIDLSWVDNASNEDSVTVLRSPMNGNYSTIATLGANTTSYSDTTVVGNTTYFYFLRVANSAGETLSSAVSATTPNSDPTANAGAAQVVSADSNCQAEVTLDGSASSDPDGDSLTYSWTGAFGTVNGSSIIATLPLGVHNVTLTVNDGNGGSASASVTVTVNDTTAPTITINGSAALTVEAGSAYSDAGATANDNCAVNLTSSIVVSGAVNTAVPGVYTVTYTVSDASGNSSSASRTVTVIDTTAPILTLNGDASITLEAGSTYSEAGATANDSVAGDLTSSILVSGAVNTAVPGVYTLTYSVSDPSGNSASAIRTVTVVDTTAPVLTLNGDTSVTVEAGSTFTDAGATANDSVAGDLTSSVTVSGAVNTAVPGVYTLTYSVSDPSGNSASATRTVTIVDTAAPVLTLNGAASLTIEAGSTFTDAGATASDSVAGNLTSSITVSGSVNASVPGVYTLTYSVSDPSGNSASATRTVTVVDTTAPVLTLNGNASVTLEAGSSFSDAGATANDSVGGDLTSSITVSGAVNTAVPGVYTLTYSVSDPSGNSASATRTVTIVDTTAPVLTLNGAAALTIEAGSTFTDAGATASDSVAGNLTLSITVSGAVNTAVPGVYTLTYSVSDPSGNSASAIRTVTVVDTTAPVLTLNGAAALTIEVGSTFTDAGAIASDSVAGNLTSSITVSGSVNVAVPGGYTLTYSVSDPSGNSASASRTVTVVNTNVVDTTAPVISSLTPSIKYLWPVNNKLVLVTLSAVVSDNVDAAPTVRIISVTCNQVSKPKKGKVQPDWNITGNNTVLLRATRDGGSKKQSRIYTITCEAVDASGNKSTKTTIVIVPHDKSLINKNTY